MTNSEWCRRYRQKTKDRERAVEIGVLAQIRELEMVAALCGRLRDDLHVEVSGVVAAATLECLDSIKDGADMCRLCLDRRLCLLRATPSTTREPQEQESCVCSYRLLFSADCASDQLVADVETPLSLTRSSVAACDDGVIPNMAVTMIAT
jgi:hypothetical protein